jgi:hypothetical protein
MIDNVTRKHVFCLDLALVPKGSLTIATIDILHPVFCRKGEGSRYITTTSHTTAVFNKLRTGKVVIEVPMKEHSKISKPRVGQQASVENRTRDIRNTKKCHPMGRNDPSEREPDPEIWSLKLEECELSASISDSVNNCHQVSAIVSTVSKYQR